MTRFLVTGGAGYVGSHTVKLLLQHGFEVVVLDSLETGHRRLVTPGAELVVGSTGDGALLDRVFADRPVSGVFHFAANSLVGESVKDPAKYFRNNLGNTLVLLDAMRKHNVKRFIFSSTAAVYGEPRVTPIPETHQTLPLNPYGQTKLMVEQVLKRYAEAYDLRHAALRYFNAAGADAEATIGEQHDPETHLIPIALDVALGRRTHLEVYGTDYPTPDGTCIRDYVHVSDLAEAHLAALTYLQNGGESGAFNLGNGQGFSVHEVVQSVRRVTGHPIPIRSGPRRAGDPAVLVASAERARADLGWRPQYPDLEAIVASAWKWHKRAEAG